MAVTTPAEARAALAYVESDPVGFSRHVLGHDHWSTPQAIMRAIAKPRARVAAKAAHSVGKTFSAADIVLWWVCSGGVAITTAPSWVQVEKLLWGAIHAAYEQARYPIGGTLNQTELRLSNDCYAIGLSTDQGVRFQGFHGRILVVLDEAPGVRPDIWEAIEGIRAGGDVRILALGNPVIASGPFYDAFANNRAGWQTFTVDAFDTPNLAGLTLETLLALPDDQLDSNVRPYLTQRRWVVEKYHEWGEQSPLWLSRVRGQFPLQSEDALISLGWLEVARGTESTSTGDWAAGLDVAGPGEDETVLTIRCGSRLVSMQAWADPDPRGAILNALAPYQMYGIAVQVDSIGIGYYMAQHIRDAGYAVQEINVGTASTEPEKYANLKAQLYWGLRLRLQQPEGMSGLTDDKAISQLAGVRYRHNARGQITIESKEDARKRGVKSPDRAESVMLAFAPGAPVMQAPTFRAPAPLATRPGYRTYG